MPMLRVPSAITGLKGSSLTVRTWMRKSGDAFAKGDLLIELDSTDSLIHLEAAHAGVLGRIIAPTGKTVSLGDELAEFSSGAAPVAASQVAASVPPAATKAPMSSTPSGNVIPILMPQAGNTMEEGRIVAWKVKVGDRITVGQVICEIETDKATIEFESTDAGRLARVVAAAGAVVPVKQPIAYLAESDADLNALLSPEAGNVVEAAAPPVPALNTPNAPAASVAAKPAVVAPPSGAVIPVLMPQASNSMEEGTVLNWRVKPGDRIAVGQIIFEIDTDKASVEVEATAAGRLSRIVAAPGAVVPVKQPVAFLAEDDLDVDAFIASSGAPVTAATTSAPVAAVSSAPVAAPISRPAGERVKASPAARKIAANMGLDLASVLAGSGPNGRILSTDLNRATPARGAAAPAMVSSGNVVRKPMSKMRKAIATNLQVSKQTVPHFYVKQTINADPLFAFYREHKPATGCTLNDVILLAVGKTVQEFPAFRSHVEGNEIVELPNANIGVAVSVEDGLVVPVILAIDRHTLATLPTEAKRVVEAGRKGKLENVGKGVFTISNMGMLGVEEFSAIINPPESGILAIAAVREAVSVKDGAMRLGRVMTLTLSVDHRVVDGAMAAMWMAKLKERLENPATLLS